MNWEPADRVQKNDKGEYRALINGEWVPVERAQKNDQGEFRVMRAESPASSGPPRRYSAKRQPEPSYLGELISNIPGSAKQYGKDILSAVVSPERGGADDWRSRINRLSSYVPFVETISGLGAIGTGAIQSLIPGEQGYEPLIGQAADYYRGRLGSEGMPSGPEHYLSPDWGKTNAPETFKQDPVGALNDVAAMFSGIGAIGRNPAATRLGTALDPVNVVTKSARGAAKRLTPRSLPEDMTMSSTKFSTQIYTPQERRALARTMLDEDILPTTKGYDKLRELQQSVGKQIDVLIDQATQTGQTVPLSAVTRELPELIARRSGPTLSSVDDLNTIFRVVDDYTNQMQARGITELTVKDLQDFKKNAYEQINWKKVNYPESLTKTGEETRVRMARAARKEIENIEPGVIPLNERYGQLAELREPLAKAVNRIDNRDLIGIGVPIKAVTGGVAGGQVGTGLGALLGMADAPHPKARMASWLEKLRTSPVYSDRTKYAALMRQLMAESGGLAGL